ncbi:MAG: (d)CMP kinase [Acidobacteria bacterium]|jgi:cytidylate kinase|nr:MAG: (d)CMP kinase [Acidobacteriota bacterium]GIU83063.1 MAG: cytidylate kinase [Pyrinomonadaceae bacterium]
MIIAIDGPSGAGKSTLGKMLAKELGLFYLDTGAMYRAAGLAVLKAGANLDDKEKIVEITKNSVIKFEASPLEQSQRIFLNGSDVTDEIRSSEVSHAASVISTIPEVRRILVERQREIGKSAEKGCVLDGRDIGSVVFPDADFKFFLTAKPETRAQRRYEENLKRGDKTTYEQTLHEIKERDLRDSSRLDSPLKVAEGSITLDTSEMNLEEVFQEMLRIIRSKLNQTDFASAKEDNSKASVNS